MSIFTMPLNLKSCLPLIAAIWLLSSCAAMFGNQPVSVNKLKVDDEHGYFILGSEYNDLAMKLVKQAKPKNTYFAPAMFEIKWLKPDQAEPQLRTYPFHQASVYPISFKQGTFQLTRMAVLTNVRSRLVYECQTIGVAGAPGSTRLCGNKAVYDPEYSWQVVDNAPVKTIQNPGVHLYTNSSSAATEDAVFQTLIESIKDKALTQKLVLHDF